MAAPAGVLAGLTAVAPSAATDPQTALVEDCEALLKALDGPANPCFIVAPSRIPAMTVYAPSLGYPVFASTGIRTDRLVCVDAAAMAAMHGAEPSFSTSIEAAVAMRTDPAADLMITQPVTSLWQCDSVSLKARLGVTWGIRPDGAAYTEPVTW